MVGKMTCIKSAVFDRFRHLRIADNISATLHTRVEADSKAHMIYVIMNRCSRNHSHDDGNPNPEELSFDLRLDTIFIRHKRPYSDSCYEYEQSGDVERDGHTDPLVPVRFEVF